MQKTVNLLLVGVGGQGIILISDIISDAAISSSYDVKKTDTIGFRILFMEGWTDPLPLLRWLPGLLAQTFPHRLF